MADLKISELMLLQEELQEKYRGIWMKLIPENGRNSLLWMVEELGEVVSIIKKRGDSAVMNESGVREAFVEEMADMLMYYLDALICYGVTADEISEAFMKKHSKNMKRDFVKEHSSYLKEK